MEVLKFKLEGFGATFTKPFSNTLFYSYPHIHKVAILGILGAVIGIEKSNKKGLPTFYTELKSLNISIVPSQVDFPTDFFVFTETSGFNNRGGATYIAKYEMLYNPSWEIYIEGESNHHYEKIKDYLLNSKAYYIPYLGKNHLPARINEVEVLEGFYVDSCDKIHSLFEVKKVESEVTSDFNEKEIYFEEIYPIGLNKNTYQYDERVMAISNNDIISINKPILKCNNINLYMV